MATKYLEIYTRAMALIRSPSLSRIQITNPLIFSIIMNNYLQFAITTYNPNAQVLARLFDRTQSEYDTQNFIGNGVQTKFILASQVIPTLDSLFNVHIGDTIISSNEYVFDTADLSINFNIPPLLNAHINIEWYNGGMFNGELTHEDITLLSMASAWAWSIQIENGQLDIDRNLHDNDFRQSAEGTTLNAKVNWTKHYEEMYKRELSRCDWRSEFRRG